MADPSDNDLLGAVQARKDAITARYVRGRGRRCWRWTGSQTRNGYGTFTIDTPTGSRSVRAHRAVFMLHHGRPIRPGYTLHHRCHNLLCVNPDHLEELTQAENNSRRDWRESYRTVTHG